MTAPGETRWILCAGASHRDAPEHALRLGLGEGNWLPMRVNMEGLERRLTGEVPPRFRDLICIAAFILGADGATFRGAAGKLDNGLTWRRDFRFVVPVSDPDFWNQPHIRRELEGTVGFLSDDLYRFEFTRAATDEGRHVGFLPPANGRTFIPLDRFDEVMLFSGGMDSLGGAVEECLLHGRKALLVSHGSSSKMGKTQRELVDDIVKERGPSAAWHIVLDVQRHDESLRKEDTQRSRSLLFAAIAGAVAWLAGRRRVRFHENGIIALNLPISGEILGARATRTVHPRVLVGFQRLLTEVAGESFTVDNPYQFLTRAQVAERIRDAGARNMLRHSRSCAHVRHATTMTPFCGICSQCIDRRFAVRAAGLVGEDPDEMYELDIFSDPLVKPEQVKLGLGYVGTALELEKIVSPVELQRRFGELADVLPALATLEGKSQDAMLAEVLALHQRQGRMVASVIAAHAAEHFSSFATGGVETRSLLSRVLGRGIKEAERTWGPATTAEGEGEVKGPTMVFAEGAAVAATLDSAPLQRSTFFNGGRAWVVGMEGTAAKLVEDSDGMRHLAWLLAHPGRSFWVLELEALERGEAPPPRVPSVGASLDDQAIAAIRSKIESLRGTEELAAAIEAAAAREEREQLEDQLVADLKLGGRGRDEPPEVRRSRDRVRKAIDKAITNIKSVHMPLGAHLARSVSKGAEVAYVPDAERTWRLAP